LLDNGLVTMGAADIADFSSPADVSTAIRERLADSVLAQVDIRTGTVAACLMVGAEDVLGRLGLEFFDAGFGALDRMLGEKRQPPVPAVVHRGLYMGSAPGLQSYVMVSGLDIPRQRLRDLAKRGGLNSSAKTDAGGSTAAWLGVDDAKE
jgi:hypothetical protein